MTHDRYQKTLGKHEALSERTIELQTKITDIAQEVYKLEQQVTILFKFGEWINRMVKQKLETITNIALRTIFPDKEMLFKVVTNHTKRGVFYDLYIETNGVQTDLHDAKGGGVLDVIQMCLRVTYINRMKGKLRQFLLLDEPFKNLDSVRVDLATLWLKQVSETLGIQFLIITHIPNLILTVENSGSIEIRYLDGASVVVQ